MMLRRDPKVQLLRRLSLFAECSRAELFQIAAIADRITLPAGGTLMTEGSRGQELVVIVEGNADVYRKDELVATLGKDSFVGEISLVTGEPRTATVVARTPVSLLVIAAHRFEELAARVPGIRAKVEAVIPHRLG